MTDRRDQQDQDRELNGIPSALTDSGSINSDPSGGDRFSDSNSFIDIGTGFDLDAISAEETIELTSREGDPSPTDVIETLKSHASSRYEQQGELGSGGMAVVYDSLDKAMLRRIAVKVLHHHHHDHSTASDSEERSPLMRFVDEAQITAQLEHPNIPPVHEIGVNEEGQAYFTMKRVVGDSLRDILDKIRDGDKAAAERFDTYAFCEIFLKVCDALRFAHSRGVIHRDLKPDNIMIGRFGEVQVMDWGLAKVLGQPDPGDAKSAADTSISIHNPHARHTLDGTISGTPAYMSPEQARGHIREIDERSDVFLLGALLYEVTTMVPPFHADSSLAALKRAQGHDLLSPMRAVERLSRSRQLPDGSAVDEVAIEIGRRCPPELAAIACRALEEDPKDRYQSVEEFSRDIERFIRGESVSVFRDRPIAAIGKWIGRNQVLAMGLFVFVVMGLVALVIWMGLSRARNEEQLEHAQTRNQLLDKELSEKAKEQAQLEALRKRSKAIEFMQRATDELWRVSLAEDPALVEQTYVRAISSMSMAIQQDPSYGAAYLWRGKVLLKLGDLDGAIADLKTGNVKNQAEGLEVDSAALMLAATALWTKWFVINDQGAPVELIEVLETIVESKSASYEYSDLAKILLKSAKARQDLQGFLYPEQLRDAFRTLLDAPKELRLFAAAHPRIAEAQLFFAGETLEILSDSVLMRGDLISMNGERQLTRGRDYFEAKYTEIEDAAKKAMVVDPHSPVAQFVLTLVLGLREGDTQGEVISKSWERYLERFPYDSLGYYAIAKQAFRFSNRTYRDEVNFDPLPYIDKAIAIRHGNYPEALDLRALWKECSGDLKGALDDYALYHESQGYASQLSNFRPTDRGRGKPYLEPAVMRYLRLAARTANLERLKTLLKNVEGSSGVNPDAFELCFEAALDGLNQLTDRALWLTGIEALKKTASESTNLKILWIRGCLDRMELDLASKALIELKKQSSNFSDVTKRRIELVEERMALLNQPLAEIVEREYRRGGENALAAIRAKGDLEKNPELAIPYAKSLLASWANVRPGEALNIAKYLAKLWSDNEQSSNPERRNPSERRRRGELRVIPETLDDLRLISRWVSTQEFDAYMEDEEIKLVLEEHYDVLRENLGFKPIRRNRRGR